MDALERIIAPLGRDEFFAKYHEQKHLHLEGSEPSRFGDLVSFDQLDELLGAQGLYSTDIRIVRHDQDIDPHDYLWRRGMADPPRVAQLFASGATVVFNSLQDRLDALNRLCQELAADLGLRTQTNLYLTPPNSQGFSTHWDTHDVFVLQVEGVKRWRIFRENFRLPFDDDMHRFERDNVDAVDVVAEFELKQGDVLYIPRGVMHSASSLGEKSLHITLGVIPYTWTNLLRDLAETLQDREEDWRRSLNLSDDLAIVKDQLCRLLAKSINRELVGDMVKHQRTRALGAYRPKLANLLSQSLTSDKLEQTDCISSYDHVDIKIDVPDDDDRIYLSDRRREMALPKSANKTIDLIFNVRSKQVIGDFDDDIDWESRKVVISKLIEEGFVHKI